MFSQVEENYIKGLIGSYTRQGYKNYICHTVTENDNVYDIYIYFSKEEIKANNSLSYTIKNGILLRIDSSQRNDNGYNLSTHPRVVLANSNYNGTISINQAEFIYTDASIDYEITTSVVQPDINYNSNSVITIWSNMGILFLLVILFVYTFVKDILRIRK